MAGRATAVHDANVLLSLATPAVDASDRAPSCGDSLKAVLSSYDVHVPSAVVGGVSAAATGDDLLASAATAVTRALDHVTTHDVDERFDEPLDYGLDRGEFHPIWLANDFDASMLVTDEFEQTNYLLVALALEDRNALFTTPHVLCTLAQADVLDDRYVASALPYYVETKCWDAAYVDRLRSEHLER